MRNADQVDTSAPGYTQFSTGEVASVVPPPELLNPAQRETGGNPEVTLTQSTGPKSVVGESEPAERHADEVGTTEETIWEGQTSGKSFLVRSVVGEAFTGGVGCSRGRDLGIRLSQPDRFHLRIRGRDIAVLDRHGGESFSHDSQPSLSAYLPAALREDRHDAASA